MKLLTKRTSNTSSVSLKKKVKKTAKALGKHVIKLYSNGISRFVKIRDVNKLCQDIEDDPFIKDQMVNLGYLLVYSLCDYLRLF